MNCRDASQALSQIAVLLELHDGDMATVKSMQSAARAVAAFGERDLREALQAELGAADAVAPEVREVLADLAESNSSVMLERLQEETPEGLMEMLRVPGLGPARIRSIHEHLHIESLLELELAANAGRLADVPKFGAKTADKIRKAIVDLRATGAYVLWQHARAEAERVAATMRTHPDVLRLEVAGSIRRRMEIVRDLDIVAAVRGSPSVVAASLAELCGAQKVMGSGGRTLSFQLDNGVRVDLACVRPEQFTLALWRATGNQTHVQQIMAHAATLGYTMALDELRDRTGAIVPIPDETAFYAKLGLSYVPPEQREGVGEVDAAARGTIPAGVEEHDLLGALHCHSQYSDGGATIEQMARAAMERGLRYLGVSDHSQSNTYAGGLSRDRIVEQHAEIDALNARFAEEGTDFRVLKGIEADILPCGRVDYDAAFLDRFDFVIGSVHTRYGMNAEQMTNRVLKALDDPHLTILGHPTGRLLLTREPYAIDLDAIIEKAGRVGVAIELNADPHRLDIDWKACKLAAEKGTMVSIGPDAHSPQGFENLELGTAIARKGWLEPRHVLNTRSADEVLAFARERRVAADTRAN